MSATFIIVFAYGSNSYGFKQTPVFGLLMKVCNPKGTYCKGVSTQRNGNILILIIVSL